MNLTLSATRLSLLDPLTITLTYPKSDHPDLDALRSTLAKQFIILKEKQQEGQIVWTVSSQTPGKKVISFDSKQYPIEIYLPKVNVHQEGELAPLLTLTPHYEISQENIRLETPDNHQAKLEAKAFPFSLVFLLLFLAAAFYYLTRKKPFPPPTPKEIKEAALRDLEQTGHLSERDSFAKMSGIMRDFLKASAQTTEECLQKLTQINPDEKQLLQRFFHKADQVNYTGYQPTEKERDEAGEMAKRLIEKL